jgi:hypothetical protein
MDEQNVLPLKHRNLSTRTRVTRLGEFSPIWRLLPLGSSSKNDKSSPNFELLFNVVNLMH